MLKIAAQILKDEEGYKLAVRVITGNELEISHTKFLGLAGDALESMVMLRMPFEVEYADILDPMSSEEAIATVKKQNEEAAAAKAAEEAETVVEA